MNTSKPSYLTVCALVVFSPLTTSSTRFAAEVLNVKGSKALLDISDINHLKVGQSIHSLNGQGKHSAILKVKQIKEGKAVADIVKGRPLVGQTLAPIKTNAAKNRAPKGPQTQSYWGALAGMNNNTLTYKSTSTGDLKLSGSSNSLKGFFQEELSNQLSIRIGIGIESFAAKGTSATATCSPCKANISSFAFDAMIRSSVFASPSFKPWLGAGLGFLIPTGKSANFMDASKISARQHFQVGVGGDYLIDKKSFIPVEIIQSISPKSSQFSTEQTILRMGYGQRF